jgi:hypothetical protein
LRNGIMQIGRDITVEDVGMSILFAEPENLGTSQGAHRVTLAKIGNNPDLHGTPSKQARRNQMCGNELRLPYISI